MTVIQHTISSETDRIDQPTSPGPRLREVRLVQKLSLDDVAAQLRLDKKLVEALEGDDYELLPEPTFVRGYLRGYARLLNLPPTPIIEAYDRHGFNPPQLVPDIASRPQANSSDFSVRLVTYTVVAILAVLMFTWWQTQKTTILDTYLQEVESGGETPVVLEAQVAGSASSELVPELAPIAVEPEPGHEESVTESSSIEGADEDPDREILETVIDAGEGAGVGMVETLVDGVEGGDDRASSPTSVEEPAAVEQDSTLATVPIEVPATVPVDASENRVVESASSVQPAAEELVIRLKYDSWLEVYDRENQRLYFELARAGDSISLRGEAPIRVLIGYARGAQVQYNGKPFDHAPFTKNMVSRFTLE